MMNTLGMLSLEAVAPHDERREAVLKIEPPNGGAAFEVKVELYVNRISLSPVEWDGIDDDEDEDLDEAQRGILRSLAGFCQTIASWEVTGPLFNRRGEQIVGPDEVIPLDPKIVQFAPTWFVAAIARAAGEAVFPNRNAARSSRKR